jgi:fermentation-respiration switch protein FrsA (DUF1100 family)
MGSEPSQNTEESTALREGDFMLRFGWRVGRVLTIAYLCVLLLLLLFENNLVFVPTKFPHGTWTVTSPYIEDAEFQAADGTRLHGWFAAAKDPQHVVLYAHGNGGNITHLGNLVRKFHDEFHSTVLVFDYRGYGRSEGSPDEEGVLLDARAARAWLAKKAGVPEQDIVLMGSSLGTGVVVDLAAKDGARGLILHSAYTSLPDVAAQLYTWIPVRWLMRTQLDSLSKIGQYKGPVLQIHGDADELIPFEIGQKLFAAVPNENKVWCTLPGCDHNGGAGDGFYEAIGGWLKTLSAEK